MHESPAAITLTDTQHQQFREQGFIITGVLFTPPLIARLQAEFVRVWQETVRQVETQNDPLALELVRDRPFLADMHRASSVCASFLKGPVLLDLCRQLIGPGADCMYNQAVLKAPTPKINNAFAWHQDAFYMLAGLSKDYFDRPRTLDDRQGFVCWVAVTQTTVNNGTLWVVPGAHRQGLIPHTRRPETGEFVCQFDPAGAIPVELQAGQMLIFSKLLPHQSGPNLTRETRMAYQFTYVSPGVSNGPVIPILRDNRPA